MNSPAAERKLKLGVLGCGSIAQIAHLPALAKAANVVVTAACDASPECLERARQFVDIGSVYQDMERFLAEADIEAVLIPVPDAFHAELSIAAMRAGKHVLVEKPLAVTLEECEAMVRTADETGRQLQIGCMKRYDPALQFAHRFVAEEMGERLSLHGWYCDSTSHGRYVRSLGRPRVSPPTKKTPTTARPVENGLLFGHGVHLIDTIRYFGGEVAAVSAMHTERFGAHSWHATLAFRDGGVGSLELTCAARMDWFEGFHMHGEHGSIRARIPFPYYNRPSEVSVYDARRQEYRTPLAPDSDAYQRQMEGFAQAILDGRPVTPDGRDGLADHQVLSAIEESAASGRWMEIVGNR